MLALPSTSDIDDNSPQEAPPKKANLPLHNPPSHPHPAHPHPPQPPTDGRGGGWCDKTQRRLGMGMYVKATEFGSGFGSNQGRGNLQ
jgi:hypothetical protein